MDIKEYIASGIIESYILGDVSAQEKQEVECMSHIYPEIGSYLVQLQGNIEFLALKYKKAPPKELREKILKTVYAEIDADTEVKIVKPDFKVKTNDNSTSSFKWLSAASIALLIGASFMFFNASNKASNLKAELDKTKSNYKLELDQKEIALAELTDEMGAVTTLNNSLTDKNTSEIVLAGTDLSKTSQVRVFWNEESKRVFMKVDELPTAEEEKQYQLWAIVDGKPKDMGVIDLDFNTDELVQVAFEVENPQAFAITLEKEGGSPAPDLTNLYVIGNV